MTMPEAIRKMALLPALILERITPDAKRLGRLQPGAIADVVVFDGRTIQDVATYRAPAEPSVGVRYLIVAGTVVVENGGVVKGRAPGRPLVRRIAKE